VAARVNLLAARETLRIMELNKPLEVFLTGSWSYLTAIDYIGNILGIPESLITFVIGKVPGAGACRSHWHRSDWHRSDLIILEIT